MAGVKKILLPTDFSINAQNSIEYAIEMFGVNNVEYIMLNVYNEPNSTTDVLVSIVDLIARESEKELQKEYNRITQKYPEISTLLKKKSEYGHIANVVNVIVKEEKIDYIVMGTKGATGMKKTLVGSNTSDVVGNVKCPTLAVPEHARFNPLNKIAFAADYENIENYHVLDPIIYITEDSKAKLMVVNIRTEDSEASYEQATEGVKLDRQLNGVSHEFYSKKHNNVVKGINEFVTEQEVKMIAVIARNHRFIDRLFHKSITKQMSMLVTIPLLILHEK